MTEARETTPEDHRFRRVVMATPDTLIDRRILQEAHTLARSGKEVILLSFPVEGQPDFERHIEVHDDDASTEVKIHRVRFEGIEHRFRLLTKMRGGTSWAIGRAHQTAQTVGRWGAGAVALVLGAIALPLTTVRRASTAFFAARDTRAGRTTSVWLRQPAGWAVRVLNYHFGRLRPRVAALRVSWTQKPFTALAWAADRSFHYAILARARVTGVSAFDIFMRDAIAYYRPDVVHAHDLPALPGAVLAAKKVGARCIYDSHEIYTEQPFPERARRFLTRLETTYVPEVDLGIVVNDLSLTEMGKRYPWRRLEVIENAVNRPREFDENRRYDLLREELGLAEDQRILLFQGWMCAGRNLEALVRAFAHTPPHVHLALMGYGDYRDDLTRMAAEAGATERVHFVDARPQNELLYWTASADVGVMPYTYQGSLNELYSSPNKFYEFVASGLPILANDLPFYRTMLTRHGHGVVADLGSAEKIAEAVEHIFAMDLEDLRRKSRRAYDVINWEVEGAKLLAMYDSLEAERTSA